MFTHLHVHTEYSLLDGHGRIKDLVQKAKELGQTSLAITDHGYLYGAVNFYNACKDAGIKPIIGVELYTTKDIYEKSKETRSMGHIILLAKDNEGYHNLLKLASKASTDGFYYKPRTDMNLLRTYHEGLICLSACLKGDIPQLLLNGDRDGAIAMATELKDIFGDDFFIELQYHKLPEERVVLPKLILLAKELGIQTVCTNDVHYVERDDAFAQRVLMCMSMKTTVNNPDALGYGNPSEWYLKTEEEMSEIFGSIAPESLENTNVIADRCNVELEMGKYHLPAFPLPQGWDSNVEYFRTICSAGLKKRYGAEADSKRELLEYEMGVIEKMGFVDYFLIVSDIVTYAKKNGVPIGPGRGSAAGSIVSYCMGITNLEPTSHGLLFERFLNPERVTMPDIDIDVESEGRQLVIQHIVETYGINNVSQIITFSTLAAKIAIRDVAKALDLEDKSLPTKLTKMIPDGVGITIKSVLDTSSTMQKEYSDNPAAKQLLDVAMKVEGRLRQTGTHAAGVVISPENLSNLIPITKAAGDVIASQFDMGSVEQVGMLKVDMLGLNTLSVLQGAVDDVNRLREGKGQKPINLAHIPMNDAAVYRMMSSGQTGGVFQFESEGMRDVLRRMKPTCFDDLVAAIALFRPGPMDSIPKFIENKHDPSKITYLHPLLEPILKDTYGCIVFQEQVMAIVRTLAGYSYGRADLVRRAMAKKKADKMAKEKDYFINGIVREDGTIEVDGCLRRGISLEVAEELWNQMADFASYAFNKSHAAAYALVAYQTAFLRCHYPKQFMAAMLTVFTTLVNNPTKVKKLYADCDAQGISILPPDINRSEIGFVVEDEGIRFGLSAIKHTGKAKLAELVMERKNGPYTDLHNLIERTVMSAEKSTLTALIKSGALDSFPNNRNEMLEVIPKMLKAASAARKTFVANQISIEDSFFASEETHPSFKFAEVAMPTLPEPTTREKLQMEVDATGIYVSGHPMAEYKDIVGKKTTHLCYQFQSSDNEEDDSGSTPGMEDGDPVRVAGIITILKKHTAKSGRTMAFMTIEDQTGKVECTVFPNAYDAYSGKLLEGVPIIVYGKANVTDFGMKIIVDSISFLET